MSSASPDPAPGSRKHSPFASDRHQATRAFVRVVAAFLLTLPVRPVFAGAKLRKSKGDLGEILSRMNDAGKHLKTVTADLAYTTVTVLVNDQTTETGQFLLRNPRRPDILIKFEKPDPKVILFKKNKAEIYLPRINRIQEYDLEWRSELIQQFLLLGFGSDVSDLRRSYDVSLVDEEDLEGESAAVLELTPKNQSIASQLSKVRIWISEDSWIPIQQKFFEPNGDYLVARYTRIKVNTNVPSSAFEIEATEGVRRVKMN